MSIRSPSNYGRPDWAMPISPYAPNQQPMMPQASEVAPQVASLPPQAQTNMPQISLPPQAQTAMPSQFGGQPNAQAFAHANQNASFMPQMGGIDQMPIQQQPELSYRSDIGNAPAFMPPQQPQMGAPMPQPPQTPEYGRGNFQQGKGGRPQMPSYGFMGQNPDGRNELIQRIGGKGGQQRNMQQPPQMGQYTPPNNINAQPQSGGKGG